MPVRGEEVVLQDMSAGGSDEDASSPITNEQTKGARVRLHLVAHSR